MHYRFSTLPVQYTTGTVYYRFISYRINQLPDQSVTGSLVTGSISYRIISYRIISYRFFQYSVTLVPSVLRYPGSFSTPLLCYSVTLLLRYSVTPLLCSSVTLFLRYPVPPLPCTLFLRYPVPCSLVTRFPCYPVPCYPVPWLPGSLLPGSLVTRLLTILPVIHCYPGQGPQTLSNTTPVHPLANWPHCSVPFRPHSCCLGFLRQPDNMVRPPLPCRSDSPHSVNNILLFTVVFNGAVSSNEVSQR